MKDRSAAHRNGYRRLLLEPMVHFFILGAILFVLNHFLQEKDRAVVVTPGVKADLQRRFIDEHGRRPNAKEREEILNDYKLDEALYREALRRGLDRNDATIRQVLIEKMRRLAELEVPTPQPNDTELQRFLRLHRKRYERPRRYDFQFLTFPKDDSPKDDSNPQPGSGPNAADTEKQMNKAWAALQQGTEPSELGRPVIGGNLKADDLPHRVPAPVAETIVELPLGQWKPVEGKNDLWLVRVQGSSGGLPPLEEVRARVVADWTTEIRQKAIDRQLQRIVDLYTFEEADHGQ